MSRVATWNQVGTDVSQCHTLEELLTTSGLDYTVHKEKMFLASGVEVPDKNCTVRDNGTPIGVVSTKYTVYQNQDAFGFISDIPGIRYVRAGETQSGLVYLIGALPDLTVLGDTFTPNVIFQNSHNGHYPVKATICPLRIVCHNQFAYSFKQVRNTISIQHSRRLPEKVAQAQQLIIDTAQYMNGFTNTAEELAALHITDTDRYAIMDAFFDSTKEMTERQRAAMEEQRAFFEKCYEEDDNTNFRGTAWGIINALSDFETHRAVKQTENVSESRFMSVTFDTTTMQKMLSIISDRVG